MNDTEPETPMAISKPPSSGIPATATRIETAEEVLAKFAPQISARWFIELVLMGPLVAKINYEKSYLTDAYIHRFLTAMMFTRAIKAIYKKNSPKLQKLIYESIHKDNPNMVLSLATQVDRVIKKGSMLKIALKCRHVQKVGITTPEKLHEFCYYKCKEIRKDVQRRARGQMPKCPLVPPLFDILCDTSEVPTPMWIEDTAQLPSNWYLVQLEVNKKHIDIWRNMDFSWYTQKMKDDDLEKARTKTRTGRLITVCVHMPIINYVNDILKIMEVEL